MSKTLIKPVENGEFGEARNSKSTLLEPQSCSVYYVLVFFVPIIFLLTNNFFRTGTKTLHMHRWTPGRARFPESQKCKESLRKTSKCGFQRNPPLNNPQLEILILKAVTSWVPEYKYGASLSHGKTTDHQSKDAIPGYLRLARCS